MLRPEDLRIEIYLSAAGETERIVHEPTQIGRWHAGRMTHNVKMRLLAEIEAELREKGLLQHVEPEGPPKP